MSSVSLRVKSLHADIRGKTGRYRDIPESKTRTYEPRAGQSGAAHGGAARWGGARQDGMPTGRFAQETTDPALQGIEDNCCERLFGSTNERIPM